MDSINYLSPSSSLKLFKSENISSLFGKPNESNDLVKCIDANDLTELRQYFFPHENDKPRTQFQSQQIDYEGISLKKEEFVDVIQQIFGKEHLKLSALKFFEELQNRKIISYTIAWHNIIDTIIEEGKEQIWDLSPGDGQCTLQIKETYSLPHSKDLIFKILALDKPNSFCYTVVSMGGKIGIYDEEMNFSCSYEIPSYSFRRINKWISSASYTSSGNAIFFSTLDRSLYVYDTSRLNHRLKFVIAELPCIITCMKFGTLENNKLIMLLGDELGNVYSFIFHQYLKSFFKEKPNEKVGNYFWSEIKNQSEWIHICVFNRLLKEFVLDVQHIPKKNVIISFSKDALATIVLTHQGDKKIINTTKLRKGVQCLAYDKKFGYLATSSDKVISLWNSNNPTQYITDLYGHEKNIIDLLFLTNMTALMSISEEGVYKLWSMQTFKCFQTTHLEMFSHPKNDLGSNILFERLMMDVKDSTNKDSSVLLKNTVCEVLVASVNRVIVLSVNNRSMSCMKKPLPIRNLETKTPRPEMIFKHYNRENPLSLKELKKIRTKECGKLKKITYDFKQFVKKGAPHLCLEITDVNEKIVNYYDYECIVGNSLNGYCGTQNKTINFIK